MRFILSLAVLLLMVPADAAVLCTTVGTTTICTQTYAAPPIYVPSVPVYIPYQPIYRPPLVCTMIGNQMICN